MEMQGLVLIVQGHGPLVCLAMCPFTELVIFDTQASKFGDVQGWNANGG